MEYTRRAEAQMESLTLAAEVYLFERGRCPGEVADLVGMGLVTEPWADPWGTPYWFSCEPTRDLAVVYCAGPDMSRDTDDDIVKSSK